MTRRRLLSANFRDIWGDVQRSCPVSSGVVSFEPPVPMLSQLASRVPTGKQWLYEPKFDGFRGLLRQSSDGLVRLTSRQGKDLSGVAIIGPYQCPSKLGANCIQTRSSSAVRSRS